MRSNIANREQPNYGEVLECPCDARKDQAVTGSKNLYKHATEGAYQHLSARGLSSSTALIVSNFLASC